MSRLVLASCVSLCLELCYPPHCLAYFSDYHTVKSPRLGCMVLCLLTFVYMCVTITTFGIRNTSNTLKNSLPYATPFVVTPSHPLCGNRSVLHQHSFVFSRMSYRWSHTVSDLSRLAFVTQGLWDLSTFSYQQRVPCDCCVCSPLHGCPPCTCDPTV